MSNQNKTSPLRNNDIQKKKVYKVGSRKIVAFHFLDDRKGKWVFGKREGGKREKGRKGVPQMLKMMNGQRMEPHQRIS